MLQTLHWKKLKYFKKGQYAASTRLTTTVILIHFSNTLNLKNWLIYTRHKYSYLFITMSVTNYMNPSMECLCWIVIWWLHTSPDNQIYSTKRSVLLTSLVVCHFSIFHTFGISGKYIRHVYDSFTNKSQHVTMSVRGTPFSVNLPYLVI